MRAAELMTRDVTTCEAAQSASEAARVMWDRDCGFVPVVERGRLRGVVTDRDLLMAAQIRGQDLGALRLETFVPAPVATCRPDDTVESALDVMASRQVRRLPVVDGDQRLVGVLSLNDVAIRAKGDERLTKRLASTLAAICRHRTPDETA
jgi:CBS domain-containing protein